MGLQLSEGVTYALSMLMIDRHLQKVKLLRQIALTHRKESIWNETTSFNQAKSIRNAWKYLQLIITNGTAPTFRLERKNTKTMI